MNFENIKYFGGNPNKLNYNQQINKLISNKEEENNSLQKLNKEENVTIILITHYMEEIIHADKVFVMDKGAVAMQGTPSEIFSQVEKLKELSLDVPQVTELAWELRKAGFDISPEIISEKECVEAIEKLFSKRSGK